MFVYVPTVLKDILALSVSMLLMAAPARCEQVPSSPAYLYTELFSKTCHTVQIDKETGNTTTECPGVGGYRLRVADEDERMSLAIVTPEGKVHPLNFWDVITPAMCSLGPKAEWLVVTDKGRLQPTALIARVNAREGGVKRITASYLAVATISADRICVTDRIAPGKSANQKARQAAAVASVTSCMTSPPP